MGSLKRGEGPDVDDKISAERQGGAGVMDGELFESEKRHGCGRKDGVLAILPACAAGCWGRGGVQNL